MESEHSHIESPPAGGEPKPKGHYAPAIKHDGLIYISGQLPVRPDGTHQSEASFEAQTKAALDNLFATLHAFNSDPRRLLKITAYIVGIENWPRFDAIYAAAMGDALPARSVVPVPELHYGYLIEIDAIAASHLR